MKRLTSPVLTMGSIVAAGTLALAACGSSGSSGGGGSSAAGMTTGATDSAGGAGSGAATVAVRTVAGHAGVLVTPSGKTLYVSDQEHGKALCVSSACTAVWMPLTVAKGDVPTGPSQVAGELGTVRGAGGKTQITFDGQPLYTFSFDHGAGQLAGDGVHDSFAGTNFSWHAAALSGAKTAAPTTSGPATSGTSGGGGGGYGY